MRNKVSYLIISFFICLLFGGFSAFSSDAVTNKEPHNVLENAVTDNYPLDTCPVTGVKLETMGKTVSYIHNGQEIRLCCYGCLDVVKKDPEKYVQIIEDAKKKNQK